MATSAFYSLGRIYRAANQFFPLGIGSFMLNCDMGVSKSAISRVRAIDEERMAAVVAFTAKTLTTDRPVPFGALIVHTGTGVQLLKATNAVARENDPSSHAELRAVRLGMQEAKTNIVGGLYDVFHV